MFALTLIGPVLATLFGSFFSPGDDQVAAQLAALKPLQAVTVSSQLSASPLVAQAAGADSFKGPPVAQLKQKLAASQDALFQQAGQARAEAAVQDARDALQSFFEPARSSKIIGVTTRPVDEALAAYLRVAPHEALQVVGVNAGLPAEAAGVRRHDVIVSVDGMAPVDRDVLRELIQGHETGDAVLLGVMRGGESLHLPVTVVEASALETDRAGASVARLMTEMELGQSELMREAAAKLEAQVRMDRGLAELEASQAAFETARATLVAEMDQRKQVQNELEARLDVLRSEAASLESARQKLAFQGDDDRARAHREKLALVEQQLMQLEDQAAANARALEKAHVGELKRRAAAEELAHARQLMGQASAATRELDMLRSGDRSALLLDGQVRAERVQALAREAEVAAQMLAKVEAVQQAQRAAEQAALAQELAHREQKLALEMKERIGQASAASTERLAAMEDRMARMEALLERLVGELGDVR